MLYLSIALGLAALCAWDGWRRKLAQATDLHKQLAALDERLTKVEAEPPRLESAIVNGVKEMRHLLVPLQRQVLAAQQQRERD